MKRLILAITILISISAQGQQIPNGDFETWVQESYGEEPANWGELNLQLSNSFFPGILSGTIIKSSSSYSGNYAMELRSITNSIFSSPPDTIIPAVILNLKNSNMDSIKMKINNKLGSLSGYIKQDIINVDSNFTSIAVLVYSDLGDLVGVGGEKFDSDIINYTPFDIPILYLDTTAGDSIEVYITGGNSDLQIPGNVMTIDALELNYLASTELSENKLSNLSVFPNPTNNIINIELENYNGEINLEFYDLSGKLLKSTISKNLDIEEYSSGIYLLKVAYDNKFQKVKIIKD